MLMTGKRCEGVDDYDPERVERETLDEMLGRRSGANGQLGWVFTATADAPGTRGAWRDFVNGLLWGFPGTRWWVAFRASQQLERQLRDLRRAMSR